METTKKVGDKMGILPRLRLGSKLAKGGVRPTGPHLVKFISDKLTTGFDSDTGQEIQGIEYIVEEKGRLYRWFVPLYDKKKRDKEGKPVPHYLIEKLMTIKEGDEVVLEMMKFGSKNYIDVGGVIAS